MAEKSGVHITGGDSGWPVASAAEPDPHKDGTGADPWVPAGPVADGAIGTTEVQRLVITATGGTFTLTFDGQTTAAIAYDANSVEIQMALEALSNVGTQDLAVNIMPGFAEGAGHYDIRFVDMWDQFNDEAVKGPMSDMDVPQITVQTGSLTGGSATVTTVVGGAG